MTQRPIQLPARSQRLQSRRGFTLVELLASIAIVLLLIVGVQQVFRIASSAVGAGQALSTVQRDNRTLHSVIYSDLRNMVSAEEMPFFIIRSERVAAFRNEADRLSDRDYDPGTTALATVDLAVRSTDYDGDNTERALPVTTLNGRNHRVDSVRFFARDFYRRQTGNETVFVAPGGGPEAYITYGHLNVPTNQFDDNNAAFIGTAMPPGINNGGTVMKPPSRNGAPGANDNNFYAQDFLLGRNAMILREPQTPVGGGAAVISEGGVSQAYAGRPLGSAAISLAPFWDIARTTYEESNSYPNLPLELPQARTSRYDLMGIGMSRAQAVMSTAIAARTPLGEPDSLWFNPISFRYAGWPFPTKPHTPRGLARTSPVLLAACSQFVVEYAGDFIVQNQANGNATGYGQDGEIDYIPIPSTDPGEPPSRRTRWYGFPRNTDTSDDGAGVLIQGGVGAPAGGATLRDVVPLRDVLMTTGFPESAPFERMMDTGGGKTQSLPARANYAAAGAVAPDAAYVCAWGPPGSFTNWGGGGVSDPPLPRMLRFVIAMEDPQGNLNEEQYFEYVVELP